jgi:hypothetical protein
MFWLLDSQGSNVVEAKLNSVEGKFGLTIISQIIK